MAPVILFDGVCHLCHNVVRWVIQRDHRKLFRFASLQSAAARHLLAGAGAETPDSIVLVDDQGVHVRSAAAIRIARQLGFPWSMSALAMVVPRFLRDGLYSWIARNRYRWFGRHDSCLTPSPELRNRFLDAAEFPYNR